MKQFSQRGEIAYIILFIIAMAAVFLVSGGGILENQYNTFGFLKQPSPKYDSHTTDQLHTLEFMTVTPTIPPSITAPAH